MAPEFAARIGGEFLRTAKKKGEATHGRAGRRTSSVDKTEIPKVQGDVADEDVPDRRVPIPRLGLSKVEDGEFREWIIKPPEK